MSTGKSMSASNRMSAGAGTNAGKGTGESMSASNRMSAGAGTRVNVSNNTSTYRKFADNIRTNWDLKSIAVIVFATLFLVLDKYHSFGLYYVDNMVFNFILPILVILFIFKENPKNYGLCLGNWRLGLKYVAGFSSIMLVLNVVFLFFPSMTGFYGKGYSLSYLSVHWVKDGIALFGWEYIFRGFLLFGLYKKFGNIAIFIQLMPFVLLHTGKPEIETLGTIISGTVLGYAAIRCRAFWPAWLIHSFTAIIFDAYANMGGIFK